MSKPVRKKIGFGTVGLGMIAQTHLIGMNVSRLTHPDRPWASPVAICTRRPAAAVGLPYERVYTDPEALIADEEVQVVDICTPNHLHAPVAMAALRAGKAVYVEKPISHSCEETEALCALAAKTGLPNQTALVMRFRPDVNRMKDMLRAGAIGKVLHFRACFYHGSYLDPNRLASWRQNMAQAGGGAMMDLGIHMLDLLRYLLEEEVVDVKASMRTVNKRRYLDESHKEDVENDTDEYGCAMLQLSGGAVGILESSRVSDSALGNEVFEVFGSKGSLSLRLDGGGGLWLTAPGEGARTLKAGSPGFYEAALLPFLPGARQSMGPFMDAHAAAVANLAAMVGGEPGFPGTPDLAEGLQAQKLVDRCLEAATWS